VSELKFIKDELIENHTLQLISKKIFEKSRNILHELSHSRKSLDPLLKKIINHHNQLTILLDGIDQPIKEKQYKENHWGLTIEMSKYFDTYKEVKRKIFDLIKAIIKQGKQKRLLN
jgi:uncharacterized membrane protein YgaE (UPF0421/DUF939 family)